jgi:hypothetical protein
MRGDRLIQIGALAFAAVTFTGAGVLLPGIMKQSEKHGLRYTDVSVDGAPPFIAIGTAIGAMRGLIVDYLWIKINLMKDQGLYYEVMADAEMITKLQPRFAPVWTFHGHNMAYNISVATNTPEERWEWVNAGIRLVRNEGLRANPNNLVLHKDLAFWHAHKLDGVSDDAHLFYKLEFARMWHSLLGEPPADANRRVEWIKAIADAPSTLQAAEMKTPGVLELVERLRNDFSELQGDGESFGINRRFLSTMAWWDAINEQSYVASTLGAADELRSRNDRLFLTLERLANDPEYAEAWKTLMAHARKRVLLDEFNMDPKLMYEFTRELGPIDWRHPQAHALYWARKGTLMAEHRMRPDDIYNLINNDRLQVQALQGLARSGRIHFDPFAQSIPGRFPEPRFIETIDSMFDDLYTKYYDARGAGGETFIVFIKNFLSSSIREWYRQGEIEKAQALMDRLDSLFGRGGFPPNNQYNIPLDVFVANETRGEYDRQPHLAPSDVSASLRYGFRVGIGQGRPEVYREAIKFANEVTTYYKSHETVDYTTKLGSARMRDIIGQLEQSAEIAFLQLMIDPSIPMEERMTIWAGVDEIEPQLRLRVYDKLARPLGEQLSLHPLSRSLSMGDAFPEPPGLDAWRQQIALERQREQQAAEAARKQGVERK